MDEKIQPRVGFSEIRTKFVLFPAWVAAAINISFKSVFLYICNLFSHLKKYLDIYQNTIDKQYLDVYNNTQREQDKKTINNIS